MIKKYIQLAVLFLLISGFVFIGRYDFKVNKEVTDEFRISEIYPSLEDDNLYDILTNSELSKFLESGTGVLFLGSDETLWSDSYAYQLNEVATLLEVEEIKYFDLGHAKETGNRQHDDLVKKLRNYTMVTDDYDDDIYAPMAVFIKNGSVVGVNNDTAFMPVRMSPEEYWDTTQIDLFTADINYYIFLLNSN